MYSAAAWDNWENYSISKQSFGNGVHGNRDTLSFDGWWSSRHAGVEVQCQIIGQKLFWQSMGTPMPIKRTQYEIVYYGTGDLPVTGKLDGQHRLVWSDGDIWQRMEKPASCEQTSASTSADTRTGSSERGKVEDMEPWLPFEEADKQDRCRSSKQKNHSNGTTAATPASAANAAVSPDCFARAAQTPTRSPSTQTPQKSEFSSPSTPIVGMALGEDDHDREEDPEDFMYWDDATVVADFDAEPYGGEYLSLKKGDIISVNPGGLQDGWAYGVSLKHDKGGWFPPDVIDKKKKTGQYTSLREHLLKQIS